MDFPDFFAAVVSVFLAGFGFATWIFSRRQNIDYEKIAKTSTFHCLHCDSVYTSSAGRDTAECPNCGYRNPKLKF